MENSSSYSSIVGTKDLCNHSRQSTRHSALQDYHKYYKRRTLYRLCKRSACPYFKPLQWWKSKLHCYFGYVGTISLSLSITFSNFKLYWFHLFTFFIYFLADNHPVHRLAEVRRLIIATGALLRFLPPYCPDLNPVEMVIANAKAAIREQVVLFARSRRPRGLVLLAVLQVTQDFCQASVRHCGYWTSSLSCARRTERNWKRKKSMENKYIFRKKRVKENRR